MKTASVVACVASILLSAPVASAQSVDSSESELAKKLANPLANLISVPLQSTWASGMGNDDATGFIFKLQPLAPFELNGNWNLITRTVIPIMSQPALTAGGTPASGFGDIQFSTFVSPARAGAISWGVGPIVSLPSTSAPSLGTQKWSAGPTAAAIIRSGAWTYGAVANQLWSFAGNSQRADVSQMFVQPFVSYTTRNAVTVGTNLEATANWNATGSRRWTTPLNVQVGKLATFGPLPANYALAYGRFVAKPDGGPSWQLRSTVTFLLPTHR
jgi:hypothetical protein